MLPTSLHCNTPSFILHINFTVIYLFISKSILLKTKIYMVDLIARCMLPKFSFTGNILAKFSGKFTANTLYLKIFRQNRRNVYLRSITVAILKFGDSNKTSVLKT